MATVAIRPKNASFAKSCPERVQLDVLQPCEPLPDSPFLQKLSRAGDQHEDETIGGVFDTVEGAVVIDADDPDAREWHTRQAIAQGAQLIAGGRLPVDFDGHRVGEPDLLVSCGYGYLPVDVKSHKSLEPSRADRTGGGTALVSEVAAPYFESARLDMDFMARRHVGDLLQLAHYRRLLEAAGWASTGLGRNVGGICGSEGVIVWYDLDAPVLEPPEHVVAAALPRRISAMERYDLEFALRLKVSVAAEAHVDDASVALLAEPIVCKECAMCRWREWCGSQLEAVADLSLVSGVGVARRRLYMDHGVEDLYGLAGLDWTTAELVRRGVDLSDLTDRVREGSVPGPTPLATVIPKRKKQLDDLAAFGFVTAGDLARLDGRTFVLCAAGDGSSVANQIELARARVGGLPAYRRRDVVSVEVPRADIEIDVDMESTNDGCYLWGALATDRREPDAAGQYLSFASWDADIEAGELAAFEKFWSWFSAVRARAAAAGASFRAYCYSRSAEEGQMTRLADRLGVRDEVDAFLASDEWVDLLEVVRKQLVTGRSMGLKETAPLAGFSWRFDDAGGTLAMVKYDEAVDVVVDAGAREAAAQWILDYNEDDVRATAALRSWLDGAARMLPSIASWGEESRSAA
ncbi:MAG TPA: TM0106 family RecB-like putative nuclease [Acidimicrobiales bacterium]|nr:TM0106 family RecB-like putative nuclease [Acidimicrobiales bacterium]